MPTLRERKRIEPHCESCRFLNWMPATWTDPACSDCIADGTYHDGAKYIDEEHGCKAWKPGKYAHYFDEYGEEL